MARKRHLFRWANGGVPDGVWPDGSIQNDSGLSQGLACHFGGGSQTEASEGFAMAMTSYLDDFDVDAETRQVLDLALEMTRTALGLADILQTESSPSTSSNLPGPASGIPVCCAKAH